MTAGAWGRGAVCDDDLGDRGPGMGQGAGQLGRLGGVEHGEFTVTGADGKAVVMTLQRGEVTSASATSVAVRSDDGFAQTYVVNDQTRVGRGAAAGPMPVMTSSFSRARRERSRSRSASTAADRRPPRPPLRSSTRHRPVTPRRVPGGRLAAASRLRP